MSVFYENKGRVSKEFIKCGNWFVLFLAIIFAHITLIMLYFSLT